MNVQKEHYPGCKVFADIYFFRCCYPCAGSACAAGKRDSGQLQSRCWSCTSCCSVSHLSSFTLLKLKNTSECLNILAWHNTTLTQPHIWCVTIRRGMQARNLGQTLGVKKRQINYFLATLILFPCAITFQCSL